MVAHIEFQNISKRFGGTVALNNISFKIKKGEIHCLCGENGAGKSTLINLCGGALRPNEGSIIINGKTEIIKDIEYSKNLGISVVHQEVPLCQNMSIAHNIFLGSSQSTKGFFLDEKYMFQETEKILHSFQLKLNPSQILESLSIAEQSIIQIAKALYFKPEFLILDEPTSALTNNQRDIMFERLREYIAESGATVLYVSHRLDEIMTLGDTATILRDGAYIATLKIEDINVETLISLMVGREIENNDDYLSSSTERVILSVRDLGRHREFENVSFDLREGEILGLAGFIGAGRTELLNCIFGVNKADTGGIYINENLVNIKKPTDAIKNEIALIPENRRYDAIIPEMSVLNNGLLVVLKKMIIKGLINKKKCNEFMSKIKKKYLIKANNADNSIMTLSGGNQQKVIIARWVSQNPKILLCDEPTRGIDIGAKHEIYDLLREIAKLKVGIIIASSELVELLTVCDRILVLSEGRVTGEVLREEATEEKIVKYASAYVRD